MRKSGFDSTTPDPAEPAQEAWLDLDKIAQVAVTSEDPNCPIESALISGISSSWRAGGKGEQTIRLAFDPPQRIKRIWLRFIETEAERTQEFTLRWRRETNGNAREIVRQQWNFSPVGSTTEVEDYQVDLDGVGTLELIINPDISQSDSVATLAELRIA
jgi:hypothetical protein